MSAIVFRSQDLHANGIHLQLVSGYSEPLGVRGYDTVVPGRRGRIRRSRMADTRSLQLAGYVAGATPADWRISTDLLMAILDMELDPGDLILTAPYLGIASGTATIGATTVNVMPGPIFGKLFQRWNAELESVDPDWVIA